MAKQNPTPVAPRPATPAGRATGARRSARPVPPVAKPAAPAAARGRQPASRLAILQQGLRDTVAELRKVQWPDRLTTRNLTLVVIGMSVALSLVLGAFDLVLTSLVEWLIRTVS
jgi:preprotein translocase subunit SecE